MLALIVNGRKQSYKTRYISGTIAHFYPVYKVYKGKQFKPHWWQILVQYVA